MDLTVDVSQRWTADNNPFSTLYLDLTERCNMDCNYCYNPERSNRDLDPDYFQEFCQRLPGPVTWRFLGGEPTLHPRFFDFLDCALKHEHIVFFASNGLKYLDDVFMQRLAKYSGKVVPGLSMDGGTTNTEIYQIMNNRDCLEQKLRAIENLRKFGIGRLALSAIIIRGENEQVMSELYDLAIKFNDVVRFIHYRSAAKLGRWIETPSYDLNGLKRVAQQVFTEQEMAPRCIGEINCNGGDGECCYRFRPTRTLQVSLIEFASPRSAMCPYRGKVLNNDFVIEPFFGNMISEGTKLGEKYGEVEITS